MIPHRLREIVSLTGGELYAPEGPSSGDVVVDGPVVTDSREAGPGSLYVARIGEHMDGHDFIAPAAERGAVAALTTRSVGPLPAVVVPDVQTAFAALARHLVDSRDGLTVIGITGSSGKTGTKDLLGCVLERAGSTIAPVGSLNSEVGVPLTACRITEETRFLVVEMGARGAGHIRYLTEIAPPDLGVVLNVGVAHVGEFGSKEAIGRAKRELVEALPATGVAVLNVDDPVVAGMASHTDARVVGVGTDARADVRAESVTLDGAARPSFTLVAPSGSTRVRLALHGEHHVGNALAVAAVALECGMALDDVGLALTDARPSSRWRMEVTERSDGVTVVNDAYNANPDSVRAALTALAGMGRGRRTWAVLGAMLELGDTSEHEHRQVGEAAAREGVDHVVVVGDPARPVVDGVEDVTSQEPDCPTVVTWLPDADAAHTFLATHLTRGDVVLLKSSRDAGLRVLGDRLTEAGEVLS